MARTARVIVVGYPHHVIQRGNRRQKVFFNNDDKAFYLDLLRQKSCRYGLDVWAYCLMDNHVHLIVVPRQPESISRSIGETHKDYTRMVNLREGWRGHLWQNRFKSFVMEERYLYAAIRYVENNPVRAKIVDRAEDYPWSSARAHVEGRPDQFLEPFYLQADIKDWSQYLSDSDINESEIRERSRDGKPLGGEVFIGQLAGLFGKSFERKRPGPKPKTN